VAAPDADWAERDDGTGTTGNVVFVGGCALSWICASQHCVAHSSCESEYVALDSARQLWTRSRIFVDAI
jgi:hypothetical protein